MFRSSVRTTLFPYTTLFRSEKDRTNEQTSLEEIQHESKKKDKNLNEKKRQELTIKDEQEDRKSTRLNSSHVANSYAVFCLNKNISETKVIREHRRTEQVHKT